MKHTMKYFLLSTAFLAGIAIAEPDEVKNSANVSELIEVMGLKKQMMGGFDAMMPVIEQQAAQWNLDEQGKADLRAIYRSWFEDDIDHDLMGDKIAALYEDTFTDEEIVELIAFYKSPLGKKLLEKNPELMQKGAQIGMEEAQKKQGKLMDRLQPFMEKHGL